jgi:50S ribosomal protein L16 3-hydroxylase
MNIELQTPLLAGLSPAAFMRRHWQKKPLLVRAALDNTAAMLPRSQLFALAAQDGVESRLITKTSSNEQTTPGQTMSWKLRHGPITRRALPSLKTPGWTLLVQGVDLHWPAAHQLLQRFRFVPDARLDDVMVSFATSGGGVGPHTDDYDVFLLQIQGQRRWQIGRISRPLWQADVPLKLLQNFEPQQEWLLEPGDMLYLPPGWAHDGVAQSDDCMTASIGFRAPTQHLLAQGVLQRLLEEEAPAAPKNPLYRDSTQAAVSHPAQIPSALQDFALDACERLLQQRHALTCALGESLTEPKPQVWFEVSDADITWAPGQSVRLDPRSRMLYDERCIYLNGESFRVSGRDRVLMLSLADERFLSGHDIAKLSQSAREALQTWLDDGWLGVD